MAFEEVDHTADWALLVRGADLAELLANAARGMLELAGVEAGESPGIERTLKLDSLDRESLLVDFLQELLVALELREALFQDIHIHIKDGRRLRGTVQEVPYRVMTKQIKAVTFNDLEITEAEDGLSATVVFDV